MELQFISSMPKRTKLSVAAVAAILCLSLAAYMVLTARQEAKAYAQLSIVFQADIPNGPMVTVGPNRGSQVTLGVDRGQPLVFEADNSYYDANVGCTAYFKDWSRWFPDAGGYEDPAISTLPKVEYTVPNEYNPTIYLVARYFWSC